MRTGLATAPRACGAPGIAPAPEDNSTVTHPGTEPSYSSPVEAKESRGRVLVADDAPDVAYLVATFFRLSGYEAETAPTAASAFRAARRGRFDAVVSDVGMPDQSGYELARALRALPGYSDVPMVSMSGFAEYADARVSREAGFDAHVSKPLDLGRLGEIVEGLIGGRGRDAGEEGAATRWEMMVVHVREDAEGRPWHVLLVGPGVWLSKAKFGTREEAEAYEPPLISEWVAERGELLSGREKARLKARGASAARGS